MSLILYHHPHSRAATVVWMLEEVGVPYTLRHVELSAGEQKSPELLALNAMGKLPILVDGDTVVTEVAAIGLYLADRYAPGRLAPALDDPARGAWLRWSFFAPSVIEPGCMAKAAGWTYRSGAAGWGDFEPMLEAVGRAITPGPWVLGERFSMVDVVLGATLRYMVRFNLMPAQPELAAYITRLEARPACQRAEGINAQALAAHTTG